MKHGARRRSAIAASLLLLTATACSAPEPPETEHSTADGGITSDEPVRAQEIDPDVDTSLVLDVDRHAIAVLPDGVAGLDNPEGTVGWSYRVPGQEPTVDITADSQAVVVTHTIPGRWNQEHTQETVLDISTGKTLHEEQLPSDTPAAPDLGTEDLRILTDETVRAQWRDPDAAPDDGGDDAWEVDPTSFCGDDATDLATELSADDRRIYLAMDCGDGEGRLVALSSRSGEPEWEQEFIPADGAPRILLIGNELRAGLDNDPVGRALDGDFGSDHRYLDPISGGPVFPAELEDPDTARVLEDHLTLPGSGAEDPVGTFILSTRDVVDAHVMHQSVQQLLDQGVLSPEDLDEKVFHDPEEQELHTPDDQVYYFPSPRSSLRTALQELAE